MRGGYSAAYGSPYSAATSGGLIGGSQDVYDRLYAGAGMAGATTTDIYGRPTSPGAGPTTPRGASRSPDLYSGLAGGYGLGGAPAASTPPAKPTTHDALYGRSPGSPVTPVTPPGVGAGASVTPRGSSILSDNPYSLGTTSYKSSLSAAHRPSVGMGGLGAAGAHRGAPRLGAGLGGAYGQTATPIPTTSTLQHTASFSLGLYGGRGLYDEAPGGSPGPVSPGGTQRQGQRIRGTSFRDDYCGLSPRSRAMRRAPSMLGQPGTMMIPPQAAEDRGKYSIVLDLDETLIYARDGPLYARPGVEELFDLLKDRAEGIAWTAGLRAYAQAVLANIDKKSSIKHCIYRHHKWFTGQAGYQKDLSLLGRSLDKTIIVENTPDCIRGNRENGILVADYEGGELPDSTIPRLTEFLQGLINSGLTVPQYLAQCPMLSRRQVATDRGDYIECYWLDTSSSYSNLRVNRDLPTDQRLGGLGYGR